MWHMTIERSATFVLDFAIYGIDSSLCLVALALNCRCSHSRRRWRAVAVRWCVRKMSRHCRWTAVAMASLSYFSCTAAKLGSSFLHFFCSLNSWPMHICHRRRQRRPPQQLQPYWIDGNWIYSFDHKLNCCSRTDCHWNCCSWVLWTAAAVLRLRRSCWALGMWPFVNVTLDCGTLVAMAEAHCPDTAWPTINSMVYASMAPNSSPCSIWNLVYLR